MYHLRRAPHSHNDGGKSEAIQVFGDNSVYANEHNDCAVRALAIAAKIRYIDAHAVLELAGRQPRHGTFLAFIRQALHYLRTIENKQYCQAFNSSMSLGVFLRRFPQGNYFVCNRNHAFAVIDSIVHDSGFAHGYNTRLIFAVKIEG